MAKLLVALLGGALAVGLARQDVVVLDAQAVQLAFDKGSAAGSMSAEAARARIAAYADEVSMTSGAAGSVDKEAKEAVNADAVLDEISAEQQQQQQQQQSYSGAALLDEAGAEQSFGPPVISEVEADSTIGSGLVLDTQALQLGVEAGVEAGAEAQADMSKVYLDEVSMLSDSVVGGSTDTATELSGSQALLDEISAEHSESADEVHSPTSQNSLKAQMRDQESQANVAPLFLRSGLGETRDIVVLDTMAMQVNIQEGAVDKFARAVDKSAAVDKSQAIEKSQAVDKAQAQAQAEAGAESMVDEASMQSSASNSDQGLILDEVGMENDEQGTDANDPFGNLFQVN